MMCGHNWVEVNDIKVCLKCGLTRTPDGKLFFDKDITTYEYKVKKKKKVKKS